MAIRKGIRTAVDGVKSVKNTANAFVDLGVDTAQEGVDFAQDVVDEVQRLKNELNAAVDRLADKLTELAAGDDE